MNDDALLVKLAIALAALAGWAALSAVRRRAAPSGGAGALGEPVLLWALTRLGPFVVVFLVLDLDVASDATRYYLPQARAALDGELVYRDFVSSYGPLFPYLAAWPVAFWSDPAALVLAAIGWEVVALIAWSAVAREGGADRLLEAQRLYLCNPLALVNVVLLGQNQVWVCALWGVAAWLVLRGRSAAAGVAAALSIAAVKLLGVLALPSLWWRAGRRGRFVAGAGAASAAAFLPFAVAGADLWQPLRLEGGQLTSGNLPYLGTVVGLDPTAPAAAAVLAGALVLGLATAAVLIERPRRADRTGLPGPAVAVSCLLLVFLLLSRKAYPNYLVMGLLPLTIAVAASGRGPWTSALFLAFCGLASIEPSLWFRWMGEGSLAGIRLWPPGREALFLAVELALLSGYVALLIVLWPGRPRRAAVTAGKT